MLPCAPATPTAGPRATRRAAVHGGSRRGSPASSRRRFPALHPRVTREEGFALGCGQIAPCCPAAGKRQGAKPAAPAAEQPEDGRGRARGQSVRPGPTGEPRPKLEVRADRGGREVALELAFPPMPHQLGQRDFHRADALAFAAEGAGVWADDRRRRRRSARGSTRYPSARDTPSRRNGRRPRGRPDNGSCRRHSGCSAACPGTRSRSSPSVRRRSAPRDIPRAHPDRPAAGRRWRTWCRRRNPARWPSGPECAADWVASSSVGTTFSMLASTTWTRGSVWVRSPLPSLVTMTLLPVSAIRKLAPVMPTSAARNFWRSRVRASVMMSRRS